MQDIIVPAHPAPQSSIELSQTAKGATLVTVKVYAADPEEAARTAARLYDDLTARYGGSQP